MIASFSWKNLCWAGVLIVVLSYPLRGQRVEENFWLHVDGLYGGRVMDLTIVPWDTGAIIAGGDWSGLTTDKGLSWQFTIIPGPRQFASDPVAKRLWAATDWGLYVTDDEAKTWTIKSGQFPIGAVNAVCVADSGVVIAGTDIPTTSDAVVYRSADSGRTWVGVYTADMGLSRCEHLYSVPTSSGPGPYTDGGRILFAIGGNHGLVRSTDGGRRWDWIREGIDAHLAAMAFAGDGRGVCFAVSNQGALYASSDQGQRWQMLFQSGQTESFTSIALCGADSTRLMIGTLKGTIYQGRVITESSGRLMWFADSIVGSAGSGINALYSPQRKEIYAGTLRSGLCYSSDSGRSYQPRNKGWHVVGYSRVGDAPNGAIAAGMGGHGVYFSSDHGLNWIQRNKGLPDMNYYENGRVTFDAMALDPTGYLYCSINTVYDTNGNYLAGLTYRKSPVDSSSWEYVPFPGPGANPHYAYPRSFCFKGSDTIYLAANAGPYRSFDHGSHWERTVNGIVPERQGVFDMVWAIQGSQRIMVGSMVGWVYRSTDGGDNWTRSETGISGVGIYQMCMDSAGTVFAVSDQIYASTDTGKTWLRIAQSPAAVVHEIAALPDNSLMFLSDQGVYRSTDHGINWFKQSEGISAEAVFSLAIDSAGYVYVSTFSAGLYRTRMPITKTTTGTGEARPNLSAIYALHQNYPNPFNPTTTITYAIPEHSRVSLRVYSILGQLIQTLKEEVLPPGEYSVLFNAAALPSGVYFYELTAGKYHEVKKLLVTK